jgi:hypothetical protein
MDADAFRIWESVPEYPRAIYLRVAEFTFLPDPGRGYTTRNRPPSTASLCPRTGRAAILGRGPP